MTNGFVFDLWAIAFAAAVAGFIALGLKIHGTKHKPEQWEQRPHLTIVKTPEDWAEHEDWVK